MNVGKALVVEADATLINSFEQLAVEAVFRQLGLSAGLRRLGPGVHNRLLLARRRRLRSRRNRAGPI